MKNHIIYLGIITLLLFLLLNNCNRESYNNKSDASVNTFLNDTISYYENELGQEIAEKVSLNGNNEALKILLSKQLDSTQQLKRLVKGFRL